MTGVCACSVGACTTYNQGTGRFQRWLSAVGAVRAVPNIRLFCPLAVALIVLLGVCCVPVCQPHLVAFLRKSFASPRGAADVWVDMTAVNEINQEWTGDRFDVDTTAADTLLARKWRLAQRGRRSAPVAADDAAADAEEGAGAPASRGKTMAYEYLHRAVSHFYQGLGNKAVAAFGTDVNNEEDIGSLRRVRGTSTKFEVVFSPGEAAAMLADDSFITEFAYRGGITRALEVAFSVVSVLDRYTEAGTVPGGQPGICCLMAHVAFVTMKIRAHLTKQAATAADSDDGDDASPVLNGGHRAEWVQELVVVQQALAAQGGRPSNGLRITDGADARCTDPSHRSPSTPTRAGTSNPPVAGVPPATGAVPQATVAGASSSPPDNANAEEPSDVDAGGPLERAAVAAAHAAVAHAMEGVYEELY